MQELLNSLKTMVEGQKQTGHAMVFRNQQPTSAASAFTSIRKSKNSVLPDSGALKSLKKKRRKSELEGAGRKKID